MGKLIAVVVFLIIVLIVVNAFMFRKLFDTLDEQRKIDIKVEKIEYIQ